MQMYTDELNHEAKLIVQGQQEMLAALRGFFGRLRIWLGFNT